MIRKNNIKSGVSVVLGYSIVLGISVVMIGILVSGFGSQLQQQQNNAVESELSIALAQIAIEIEEVDQTIQQKQATRISLDPKFTDRAGDPVYKVTINGSPSNPNVYLVKVETKQVSVSQEFRSETPIDTTSSANSTNLVIKYNETDGEIRLSNKGKDTIVSTETTRDVNGDYTIPDNKEREPSIRATGSILGGQSTKVYGSLEAGNNINTSQEIEIYGDANAGQSIDFNAGTFVQGRVNTDGNITINSDSSISKSISSNTGNITIQSGGSVGGEISTSADVFIGDNGEILSTISSSSGTVTLSDNVIVDGDVNVSSSSDLSCGTNVTINGLSCSEYKNQNY